MTSTTPSTPVFCFSLHVCFQLARGLQGFIAAEFGSSLARFPDLRAIMAHSPRSLCEYLQDELVQGSGSSGSSATKTGSGHASTERGAAVAAECAEAGAYQRSAPTDDAGADDQSVVPAIPSAPLTASAHKRGSPKWDWALEATLDPAVVRQIQQSAFSSSDVECQVHLSDSVRSPCKPCATPPATFPLLSRYRFFGNALLTGATGFLGAHILGDLIAVMHQSLNPVHTEPGMPKLAPAGVKYFRHYRSMSEPKHLRECDRALPRRRDEQGGAAAATVDTKAPIALSPQSNSVYCLVRLKHHQRKSEHDLRKNALGRIEESLARYGILDKLRTCFGIVDWREFVVPVVGDLAKQRLGLTGALGCLKTSAGTHALL